MPAVGARVPIWRAGPRLSPDATGRTTLIRCNLICFLVFSPAVSLAPLAIPCAIFPPTFQFEQYDESRDSFVCSIEEDGDMVADYSVKDFCQIAGPKSSQTLHNGASSTAESYATRIISFTSGTPVNWAELEKAAGRLRPTQPAAMLKELSGHRGGEGGVGGRKSSGTARPSASKSFGASAASKRRRDGGESDSGSDDEMMWAKAQKQCEYLERHEKQETYKQRRMIEQAALNQRFFENSKKREEPVLGVDISAPLLPEGMFMAHDETSLLEKGKAVHERLVGKGEETEDDRQKHEQWVTKHNLAAESERLHKVSREFSKSGEIHVKMYKEVTRSSEEPYDSAVTKKFNDDFHAVPWLKMPKMVEEPILTIAPRNRSLSGGASRGTRDKLDPSMGAVYYDDHDPQEEDLGIQYVPSLETEERLLFEALFACYGPDHHTICRLLCRPDAPLEVQDLVAEAAADIRCEVCRNPECEDLMILCDSCDKGYHIFCLDPPLSAIPEGDWFCEQCSATSVPKGNAHVPDCAKESASSDGLAKELDPDADHRSLRLTGLELLAQEELKNSVADGEWTKIIKPSVLQSDAQTDSTSKLQGKLTMEEIQLCPNASIFSAMLFTCPVPSRTENDPMSEILTVPLRRHLRIIAAAVKAAFTLMLVNCVRRKLKRRAAALVNDEPLKGARRGWIIQINPQLMNLEECARKEGAVNVVLRRHSNLIKVGDRVFLWKAGNVRLQDGLWEPVGGGLIAFGHVRSPSEMQALPSAMSAHLRPLGRQLDPWTETMSCSVTISHVLQETLQPQKIRTQLKGELLPIFENAVGSVYRLSTAQILALEEMMQRHDPSIFPEALAPASGSSKPHYQMLHNGERKDKKRQSVPSVPRRSLNISTQHDSTEESDGNDLYEEGDEQTEGKDKKPMWMNQGKQLLARLKKHRDAQPFLLPVNTNLYPDYVQVLSQNGCSPISLADIEVNLENGDYRSHKEFMADFKRMWKNCHVYNPEKDPMQLMATNMSQETELLWANFKKHRNKRRRAIEEQRALDEDEDEKEEEEKDDADDTSLRSLRDEKSCGDVMDVEKASRASCASGSQEAEASSAHDKVTAHEEAGVKDDPSANCNSDQPLLRCSVCEGMGGEANGQVAVCDASGAGFHLGCLKCPPSHLLDGPFIISPQVLDGLEPWQLPRAPGLDDDPPVRPCPVCKQKDDMPARSCAGCLTRYHIECLDSNMQSPSKNDKCWLCNDCQALLPSPEQKNNLLRHLVRREVVFECRRLIHLHCELCSRDHELDMDRELHRFRILKQTAALAQRIFEYNALLMREANDLLAQTRHFRSE